ncbi:MAG: ribonuclease J [Deferribacteraceae bacterium]|jgi:ribonuclease J|nr:ribonuclease J [Deferribacteraceae bacterium]
MNLYVYESDSSAVIVDYGIKFADPQICGIDWIAPDTAYLESIRHKLKAVLFTHGHEDHIGGVLRMLSLLSLPIYTGRFTAELIKHKTRNEKSFPQITVIKDGEKLTFEDINVCFFPVSHSIPDTSGIILEHNGFTAVHLSDFLNISDMKMALSGNGVNLLLLDSTNAVSRKEPHTEDEVQRELVKIFSETRGKVFLTTFASNVIRLNSVVIAAKATGRKIVIEGAAMERTVSIAARLGYIYISENDLIPAKTAFNEEPSSVVYLVSGCQGELSSALHSIVKGERKAINISEGDTLIFSSRVIPGNEINISAIINSTARLGAEIVQFPDRPVHISGHASVRELKRVITDISPEYFVPIHGEYRHLAAHAGLAAEAGISGERCLSLETGDQIIFEDGKPAEKRIIDSGRAYIDKRGDFVLNETELYERKRIARDGLVLIKTTDGKLSLRTYGFKLTPEQEAMVLSYAADSDKTQGCFDEELVLKAVKRFFKKTFNRRPLVELL